MAKKKDNSSTTFIERISTAIIITLLVVGYQHFFSITKIAPSLIIDAELETVLQRIFID